MLRLKFIMVVMMLPYSVAFSAQYGTGNWLKDGLEEGDRNNANYSTGASFGYVMGATSVLRIFERVCDPAGVTNGQVSSVVLKYLRDNPAELHESATWLIFKALNSRWPCKRAEGGSSTSNSQPPAAPQTPKPKPKPKEEASPF